MANFKIQNVRIQLKSDTAANWNASSLKLLPGEVGLDTTNNVIKIGDGNTLFKDLPNAGSVIAEADDYTAQNGGKDNQHGAIKVNGTNIQTYELTVAGAENLGGVLSTTLISSGDYAGKVNTGTEQEPNYVSGYVTVDTNGKMTVAVAP